MDGGAHNNPRTVEEVFRDFKGRRNGLIKALTTEKENLCLYGFPSDQWEVNLPAEEVPPELPEPALGINFARDGMQEKDWLALVAVHSDAWLLSVAFYFGARFGFDKADRKRLFNMINDLPTIFEVVTGAAKKQLKDKSSVTNHSGSKSKTTHLTNFGSAVTYARDGSMANVLRSLLLGLSTSSTTNALRVVTRDLGLDKVPLLLGLPFF
ncbi:hypothetical protein DH2020_045863 [Rehmannia glutinosa]|uniref:PHD finger protein ALFIN-LIKE n=1 Tax=Rehmannia glutinosa TaxID=99300 RepID=A0ABR0UCX1_REHGL